jgi:hypothetical protein
MNGTADITATAATIFERVRPLPPKRDFTPALNGEFKDMRFLRNTAVLDSANNSEISTQSLKTGEAEGGPF